MRAREKKTDPEEKKGYKLKTRDKECLFLLFLFIVALGLSAYRPNNWGAWGVGVVIPVGVVVLLIATYKKFPLTRWAYYLILIHSFILLYGAHFTYAEAYIPGELNEALGWGRNNYDRLGQFAFGFFPAVIIREVIVRTTSLKRGKMLFILVIGVIGAFAALFEVGEWCIVVTLDVGPEFVTSQGEVWDVQWDMFLALVGGIIGQAVFLIPHKKQMLHRGFITKEEIGEVEEKTQEELKEEKALKKEFEDFRTKWKDKGKKE
jgi:putative membrane protein